MSPLLRASPNCCARRVADDWKARRTRSSRRLLPVGSSSRRRSSASASRRVALSGWDMVSRVELRALAPTGTTAPAATTAQRIFGAARGDLNRPAVAEAVRRVTEAAFATQATPTIPVMPGVALLEPAVAPVARRARRRGRIRRGVTSLALAAAIVAGIALAAARRRRRRRARAAARGRARRAADDAAAPRSRAAAGRRRRRAGRRRRRRSAAQRRGDRSRPRLVRLHRLARPARADPRRRGLHQDRQGRLRRACSTRSATTTSTASSAPRRA